MVFSAVSNIWLLNPNQGCAGTAHPSCGGDCGHPRWHRSYAATETLIAAFVVRILAFVIPCCIQQIPLEDSQLLFFGFSSV